MSDDVDVPEVVERAYTPTFRRPFQNKKCTGWIRNGEHKGEKCDAWAYYGSNVCATHGAQLPVVRKAADNIVEAARLMLFGHAMNAVETIVELMNEANSESVRLKAATEVADRVGIRAGQDHTLTIEVPVSPTDDVRNRIGKLRESAEAREAMKSSIIIDQEPEDSVD